MELKGLIKIIQNFEIRATGGFAVFIVLIVTHFFLTGFLNVVNALLGRE